MVTKFTKILFVGLLFLLTVFSMFKFSKPKNNESFVYTGLSKEMYGIDQEEEKKSIQIKMIYVNYEGVPKIHFTRKPSPVLALIDLGYPLSNKNILISTSPINDLYNYSHILVESYTSTIDEIIIDIPFETIVKGTTLCAKLQTRETEEAGVLGAMSQRIKRTYKGDELIAEEVIEENTLKKPQSQIIIIKGPDDSPDSVPQRGSNCNYWNAYIDNINASEEEREWLKFTMKLESGCNAESNKAFYKGLFQWDPCLWYTLYTNDNIFDGEKQIQRTLEKIRAGANPAKMWPAVYRKYVEKYGELSWLKQP